MPDVSRLRVTPFRFATGAVPGASAALDALRAALWSEEGTTPPTTRELVFLRTSLLNRCYG